MHNESVSLFIGLQF